MANTFKFGNGEWARKTGQVLAYNSENDNYKPLPFTFDRASSATRVNKEGLIETVGIDEPRIDFLNNSKGHLLLEPSRQNIVTYSEDFSDSSYLKTNCTITSNNSISPDGTQNADKLNFTTSNGYIVRTTSFTSGQEYTMSFYAKTESGTLDFTYGNMDYVSISGTATTEWQRFEITQTLPVSTRYPKIQTTEIGSLLLWGWQVEQGSYATSYIPTSGSAVTRSAESCYQQNDYVLSNTSGTIFFEIGNYNTNTSPNGFNKILVFQQASSSSLDNVIYFEEYNEDNTILIRKGGSTVLQSTPSYQDLRGSKIGIKFSNTEAKIFIDGVLNNTYSGDVSLSLEYFGFNQSYNSSIVSSIKLKNLRLYNTALTDAELIALTS